MTVYVDPDTIRRKGDLVKMWALFDYKTKRTVVGDSILFMTAQTQYDCAEERQRGLAFTNFSGNMGRGNVVLAAMTNKSGHQLHQEVLVKLCGHLRASSSDRAVNSARLSV